jgi:hypothetical protein
VTCLSLLALLAACSSSGLGNASDDAAHSSDEAALKQTVQQFNEAITKGDTATYDRLSKRCQGITSRDNWQSNLDINKQLAESIKDVSIESVTVTDFKPPTASAEVKFTMYNTGSGAEPWVLENGTWYNDKCSGSGSSTVKPK